MKYWTPFFEGIYKRNNKSITVIVTTGKDGGSESHSGFPLLHDTSDVGVPLHVSQTGRVPDGTHINNLLHT